MKHIVAVLAVLASMLGISDSIQAQSQSAQYLMRPADEGEEPPIERFTLTDLGPTEDGLMAWQLELPLGDERTCAVRAISQFRPMANPRGVGEFQDYLFRDSRGKVTRYVDARTGDPLLPRFSFRESFLPTFRTLTPRSGGFASSGEFLGHVAQLNRVDEVDTPDDWQIDFTVELNPDLLVGASRSFKDDGKVPGFGLDWSYTPLTEEDYVELIGHGHNYFGVKSDQRAFVQDRNAFFRDKPQFPEDFYRSNYMGFQMFSDEPSVRLGWEGVVPDRMWHPSQYTDHLITRLQAMYTYGGYPYQLQGLIHAAGVDTGNMVIRQDDIPTWETDYEAAFYELYGGAGGIVHEGRYVEEGYGWHPAGLLGEGLPFDAEVMLRCYYAFLRGAARAFDRDWGTAIYGQSDGKLRRIALTLAYDMGARHLWFWTSDHDHHMTFPYQLELGQVIAEHAQTNPRSSLRDARDAATTAIVFPWGYSLFWHNGWGNGGFSQDSVNQLGVSYRDVVTAGAWEAILCAMRGEDFDFQIEYEGLEDLGYQHIIRVHEDGTVTEWPADNALEQTPIDLDLRIEDPVAVGQVQAASYTLPCLPAPASVEIDGDLSEWVDAGFLLPGGDFVASGTWTGPEDLSARMIFAYDEEYFYIIADVVDDYHNQPHEGWHIWNGDCLQLALDPLNERTPGWSGNQHEIGFALLNDGPPISWRWVGRRGQHIGPIPGSQVAIVRDEQQRHTLYEIAVPLEELTPLMPHAQDYAGVCLVLADMDEQRRAGPDEMDRKALFETSPGAMTAGKHPDQFGSVQFLRGEGVRVRRSAQWAAILPGSGVVRSGGQISFGLQTFIGQGQPTGLQLRAELEALTPLAPGESSNTIPFDAELADASRQARLLVDAYPGRYLLRLAVFNDTGRQLIDYNQLIFVYPAEFDEIAHEHYQTLLETAVKQDIKYPGR